MKRPAVALLATGAWVAVVSGHVIAYLAAYPHAPARADHLASTSHGWLEVAVPSLLAAIPVLLLVTAVSALRSERAWSRRSLALALTGIQIAVLASIELLERGWSVGEAFADPAVLLGLLLQPVLALLLATILAALDRAVRAFSSGTGHIAVPWRAPSAPALAVLPIRSWLLLPSPRRGPPGRILPA